MYKVIIISIVILFGCLFLFQQLDPKISSTGNSVSIVSVDENSISVTIEGEITVPGIYSMNSEESLNDLIQKAGGLTEDADVNAINMDALIGSHDYFYIPKKGVISEDCIEVTDVVKININKASASELATLKYISFSLAEKIIEYRETNGEFQTLEDLMLVSGIGRATYERIRDYITLK